MTKLIYYFGSGKAEGKGAMKEILGGKGSGLAEMANAGVPVPPGFTITTEVCRYYYANKYKLPRELESEMKKYLKRVEKETGMAFGDPKNPLLVSVRSGAKFSMPGMMDTILNLGLNDATVEGLAQKTGNPRFAYDCYRRFIHMFSDVVLEIAKSEFESILHAKKAAKGVQHDTDLDANDLKALITEFRSLIKTKTQKDFPQEPWLQLIMARDAVFRSWNNNRAITYRNMYSIPHSIGTAVNIQTMVFGNMGPASATGVGFTRDPSTGERKFYGEYLTNAQGEDVVAGIRTPKPITELETEMPEAFKQLRNITSKLEKHYRDIQDFEFTIQEGKLYMLQTRVGKRTGHAAIKIAIDMIKEKLITVKEAVKRVEPDQLHQLLHPIFDPIARRQFKVIAKGLNASPGAASGKVVFTADDAVTLSKKGERALLVRAETSPDDIHGMDAAKGVLTATGGMTSHAAVVGRQMGKPSIVGCGAIKINEQDQSFSAGDVCVKEGDYVSIDGATGEVMLGDVPTKPSEIIQVLNGQMKPEESETYKNFTTLLKYADSIKRLTVRANADIPRDADMAMKFGAQGIGLCRTEHMFFAEDRIPLVQAMILANNEADRRKALDKLLPLQKEDFLGLFRTMKGYPVTIRTLDPPLHEFLPKREDLMVEVAEMKALKADSAKIAEKEKLLARVSELHEFNPMLGHRGCRLGITYPEITEMQVRAIFEAACELKKEGKTVMPEVMIPLVGHINEFHHQKLIVDRVAGEVMKKHNMKIQYTVGTMIEVPRAAVTADEIAAEAVFFSFGTNDLTQMTMGFSRDDAGKFLKEYVDKAILPKDPFVTLDQTGVGKLVEMATQKGRKVRKDLKVGICGEHGGDPESVKFCHRTGLNYVSCSPFRVPIARLAAAHAVLEEK